MNVFGERERHADGLRGLFRFARRALRREYPLSETRQSGMKFLCCIFAPSLSLVRIQRNSNRPTDRGTLLTQRLDELPIVVLVLTCVIIKEATRV